MSGPAETATFQSTAMTRRRWIELGALGSLAGIFLTIPLYAPQGVDYFAVAFFLLGSLLIDERDIQAADWTGRRPFVFASAALILAIPFVSGACSVNGFKAQVASGVYMAAAPPALYLVASRARFHLVGPRGVKRLILAGIFLGLIPATIYGLVRVATVGAPFSRFDLPAQGANIEAVYLSCMAAITLHLTADLDRRSRFAAYGAVCALAILGLLTASRTILVSMALVLAIYMLAIHRRKVLFREISTVSGVIAVLVAAASFVFRSGLTRLFQPDQLGFFDGRLQTWADGWTLFQRYPLCGIGHRAFHNPLLNPLYVEWDKLGIAYTFYYHAHNIFLNTLAEGGLILGVLLLILIAAAIYGCYALLKNDPASQFRADLRHASGNIPRRGPFRRHDRPPGDLPACRVPGIGHERYLERCAAQSQPGPGAGFSAALARQ